MKEREDWLAAFVEFGLSALEIAKLSTAFPRPLKTHQQVYEQIARLGLQAVYKRRQKKRVGEHNKQIHFCFMKLAYQLMFHGQEVSNIFREKTPVEGARVQPDFGITAGNKIFYVEVQLSKYQYTRWYAKLKAWVRFYEKAGYPFRVLVIVDKRSDLTSLRRQARLALEDHPNLNLFLFMNLDEFRSVRDVVRGECWAGSWNPLKLQSLLK